MHNLKHRLLVLGCAVVILFLTTGSASEVVEIIFEGNFPKDSSGKINYQNTFSSNLPTVTVNLINGTNGHIDHVAKGSIAIDGNEVFGGFDFKIVGTVSKTIPLAAGPHVLDISLGGKAGGQITVKITQSFEEPGVEFPPGTLFVSPGGEDRTELGWGTSTEQPYRTITFALDQAYASTGVPQIVVAVGIYYESINLVNDIDLLGGFNAKFTERDIVSFRPIIMGDSSSSATVNAEGISAPTLFEGFIIFGSKSVSSRDNSIGISILNCTQTLVVCNNTIIAGVGNDGLHGQPGSNGGDGGNGENGRDSIFFEYTSSPSIDSNPGGLGGSSPAGNHGGKGGSSIAPQSLGYTQEPGYPGIGFGAGLGGAGGSDGEFRYDFSSGCFLMVPVTGMQGQPGQNGSKGIDSQGGLGGQGGGIENSIWRAASGLSGQSGENGSGGGGGGAAGGALPAEPPGCVDLGIVQGASGGGGGAGGAAGQGGAGGQGGGGSFGLYVFLEGSSASGPSIYANDIYLGTGGDGGNGGNGGMAGPGGSGGLGGSPVHFGSGVAGTGGSGGHGGHGGGGGGGAGGISVGIFANFGETAYQSENYFNVETGSGGFGGIGGFSLGYAGENGDAGVVAEVLPVI